MPEGPQEEAAQPATHLPGSLHIRTIMKPLNVKPGHLRALQSLQSEAEVMSECLDGGEGHVLGAGQGSGSSRIATVAIARAMARVTQLSRENQVSHGHEGPYVYHTWYGAVRYDMVCYMVWHACITA